MADVLYSKFDVSLEVDGTRYDIIQCSADFSLNQIPRATCLMSIGRDAVTGGDFAKIHYQFQQFADSNNIAKLYFCPSGEWNTDVPWPAGEHLIFEGRIVGTGLQKQERTMQLVVYIQHWLGDLNFSSCMSEQSHPTNISEYTFAATTSPDQTTTAVTRPGGIAATTEAANLFNSIAVVKDLWAEALKPLFCSLAQAKSMRFSSLLSPCGDLQEQENSQSLAALSRIEGVTRIAEQQSCNRELSCYTPALTMMSGSLQRIPNAVADGIATYLCQQTTTSFEHQTMWGKLVGEFAASFRFCVVPLVDKALVVPVVAGLRHTWCKRVYACDYNALDYTAEIIRPIRAVALIAGVTLRSGAPSGEAIRNVSTDIGVGGCWMPDPSVAKPGMILVQNLEPWLDNMLVSNVSPNNTLGVGGHFRSSTLTPKDPADPSTAASGRPPDEDATTIVQSTGDICAGLAHAKYVTEVLRGRSATVTGKLRFDIAPGSTVWVEGTTERFMEGKLDQLGQNLVGLVTRVAYGINAEAGKAGTTIMMSYVRTEQENEDDSMSVDCHPLYATRFIGAPLVDSLWFADEGDGCCSPGTPDSRLNCA